MSDHESLTPQEVAELLKITKNTVYELIKRGELQSFKVGRKIRVDAAAVRALKNGGSSRPHRLESPVAGKEQSVSGMVICGQDSILDILARFAESRGIRTYRSHKGSYNGLFALYNGEVQIATSHLWDGDTGIYNIPYVRRMIPGIPVTITHLVKRMQGFYVLKGNPREIHTWDDLFREDISFVNREKGSGTRVLLDETLLKSGRSGDEIRGYEKEVSTHLAAASAVCRGRADVALGIEKGAMQVKDVDFIPLQQERYEMVFLKKNLNRSSYAAVLDILRDSEFRDEIRGLGGYDISQMGERVI